MLLKQKSFMERIFNECHCLCPNDLGLWSLSEGNFL